MDRTALQRQVDRVLSSRSVAAKAQLRRLLEILIVHYDSQATLQPSRVIRELWGEETERDSKDLASAMSRLRHALETYYAEEGASDEIVIRLPRRSHEDDAGDRARRWIMADWRMERVHAAALATAVAAPAPASTVLSEKPVRRGPRVAAMVVSAAVLCALVSAAALRIRSANRLPSTARLDGNALVVVNAEGKEVWTRSFPDGFWGEFYADGLAPRMWFGDLDGNGTRSVLLLYHPAIDATARSTTLICFSAGGKERWRWNPGRVLPELGSEPAVYHATGLAVLRAPPGEPSRIVVSSRHYPQYPGQVALIDATGKTVSEYWHSGHLDYLALAEDGSGKQEIVTLGVSNGYNQATMVVLDPDRMSGASLETARPELQIHGMGIAHERLRLLFPRSDLNLATSRYNVGREITVGDGIIRVAIEECAEYQRCYQWYEFDTKLSLRNVYEDDRFRDAHEAYYHAAGRHRFTAKEEQAFWQIRCLAGCAAGYVQVVSAQAGQ